MDINHIVAIGLLTQSDVDCFGQGFTRMYPLEGTDDFQDLLNAIDQADAASRNFHGNLIWQK